MFTRTSITVKIWYNAVMIKSYDLADVPKLSNLRDVVTELYNEAMGVAEIKTEQA